MSISVIVADDQSMVRAGFRMLLTGEEDIEVVAEARNGLEAVEKAARFQPTVVLMDIRMPELDGLEATRRILAADPAARILILTTFDLDEYVYEGLRAGASGFVLKDDPPERRWRARDGLLRLFDLARRHLVGEYLWRESGRKTWPIEEAAHGDAATPAPAEPALELPPLHRPGRNDLCSCGSGRKAKRCCWR